MRIKYEAKQKNEEIRKKQKQRKRNYPHKN